MSATAPSLDPAVLAAVGDLALVARVTVEGTLSGLHGSPFHGYSAEFSQYRHYRAGDDLKYVDWKVFARTDRLYTKQYRETTNVQAVALVDASASMGYRGGGPVSKLDYARLIAAALAHLLAGQGDAAGLMVAGASEQYLPPRAGQPHLRSLLLALANVAPAGETEAGASLARILDRLDRRGLLFVLSDLYDEGEAVERELRRATRMGHEVAVFHILTREELEFPFRGDVEVEDLETGRRVLTNGAAEAAAYRRRLGAFLDDWTTRCARCGIDYSRVTTDAPLDAALRGYLLRRLERARA